VAAILPLAQALTVLACGLFAGAAVYITFVEHPARMECGTELAATEFPPSYRRATLLQAPLAAVGLACSIVAWLAGGGAGWLVGGLLLGAVIPFTLVSVMPTNRRLLDPALDKRSDEARRLLSRWARLHAVRSALGVVALATFLYLVHWPR
jgi:hypothetical protein